MVINVKYALIAVGIALSVIPLHAGRCSVTIGNGNEIGSIYRGSSGTSEIKVGNNSKIGDIITEGDFAIATDNNSVIVSNKKVFDPTATPTKILKLQGIQKKMSLDGEVGTDAMSIFECLVAVDKTKYLKEQVMFCDMAVFDAGLTFSVKNRKLVPILPNNTTIRFEGTDQAKSLCIISQMLR